MDQSGSVGLGRDAHSLCSRRSAKPDPFGAIAKPGKAAGRKGESRATIRETTASTTLAELFGLYS
ncbi:MAG: hypothetical protein WA231_22770, partial [Methylocella sp.]